MENVGLEKNKAELDKSEFMSCKIIDGIMHVELIKNIIIDMDIAKALLKIRLDMCNGEEYPTILNFDNFNYAGKEVRKYMNTEGQQGISAGAIYTKSFAVKTFFNFFISVSKSDIPTKVFSTKEDAVKWLKKFVKE